ncbi:hypothetical protein EOD40_17455 [Flavobacterium sufflavum]|uniref:Uncharacterized protein n=1 Tax=Flavobacterium sufflavum TaxID=1921138 RepID=A0A437KJZ2_9FLAO|nr:hypothetical protein [Flavobacterium sufflavum]RVT71197.1 hypothetical protein EOD40_17455 [Flavobacterium sufflavum]
MNKLQDIVDDQINKLKRCIDAIKGNDLEVKTIEIDSSYLNEKYRKTQTFSKCANFKDLYDSLPKKVPVLYWLTYDATKLENDSLNQLFEKISKIPKERKFTEIPSSRRKSSGVLYVGKVIDKFHYRFVNHLGHSVSDRTGSLQLTYWYDTERYGNLKLNYIVFKEEMKSLLGVLEIELAKELKPIVGSHKN